MVEDVSSKIESYEEESIYYGWLQNLFGLKLEYDEINNFFEIMPKSKLFYC